MQFHSSRPIKGLEQTNPTLKVEHVWLRLWIIFDQVLVYIVGDRVMNSIWESKNFLLELSAI